MQEVLVNCGKRGEARIKVMMYKYNNTNKKAQIKKQSFQRLPPLNFDICFAWSSASSSFTSIAVGVLSSFLVFSGAFGGSPSLSSNAAQGREGIVESWGGEEVESCSTRLRIVLGVSVVLFSSLPFPVSGSSLFSVSLSVSVVVGVVVGVEVGAAVVGTVLLSDEFVVEVVSVFVVAKGCPSRPLSPLVATMAEGILVAARTYVEMSNFSESVKEQKFPPTSLTHTRVLCVEEEEWKRKRDKKRREKEKKRQEKETRERETKRKKRGEEERRGEEGGGERREEGRGEEGERGEEGGGREEGEEREDEQRRNMVEKGRGEHLERVGYNRFRGIE
jgi:hypothetical protein